MSLQVARRAARAVDPCAADARRCRRHAGAEGLPLYRGAADARPARRPRPQGAGLASPTASTTSSRPAKAARNSASSPSRTSPPASRRKRRSASWRATTASPACRTAPISTNWSARPWRRATATVCARLAVLDLDDFKSVNDTLGHPVGDGLIYAVAERLAAVAGQGVKVSRFGGDEFMIFFDRVEDESHLTGHARRDLRRPAGRGRRRRPRRCASRPAAAPCCRGSRTPMSTP